MNMNISKYLFFMTKLYSCKQILYSHFFLYIRDEKKLYCVHKLIGPITKLPVSISNKPVGFSRIFRSHSSHHELSPFFVSQREDSEWNSWNTVM